jgi:hypothetical protein
VEESVSKLEDVSGELIPCETEKETKIEQPDIVGKL